MYRSPYAPQWFRNVRVCYRWYADGDGGQCGGGAAQTLCAAVGSYTAEYRDDTDRRSGGRGCCQYPTMLPSGSVMSSSATSGTPMVTEDSVGEGWGGHSVLVQTTGLRTTGMTQTAEEEAAEWPGN